MADEQLTLSTIAKRFSDEAEAYKFVESIRWPNGPVCPHCGSINHAYFLTPKDGARKTRTGSTSARRVWKCAEKNCRKQFSVLKGSIFEDSKVPLSKWLLAFHLMCSDKNGTAAYELHRTLNLDRKTAWFLAMRIRFAMQQEPLASKLAGVVEVDETYMGGAAKNMHKAERERRIHGSGAVDKTPVVSLVQRGGQVRSQVMHNVTGAKLRQTLRDQVEPEARIMSDTFSGYRRVGEDFASHETVNHLAGEYVRGDVYTNSAEGYFSQLKLSIDGTHHHVSDRHLWRYLGEFDFRFNTRKMKDGERTKKAIQQAGGKRLTYRAPAGASESDPDSE